MSPLPGRHGDRNDIIDFDVPGDDGEPMIVSLGFIPTLRTVKGKRMDRRLRNDLKDALMRYIMGLGEDASAGAECESEAKLQ